MFIPSERKFIALITEAFRLRELYISFENEASNKAIAAFESLSRISEHLSMTSRRFTAAVSVDLRRSEVRRASYNGNKILEDS